MNKKCMSKVLIFVILLIVLGSFPMISFADNSTSQSKYSDVIRAFQEVTYAYYMRGKNIQYNGPKARYHILSPEESTSQRTSYAHCMWYGFNVYNELLGDGAVREC